MMINTLKINSHALNVACELLFYFLYDYYLDPLSSSKIPIRKIVLLGTKDEQQIVKSSH